MSNNIAFVYHYWNIENLKSYYGYKASWNKRYSAFELFVTHPTIEKNNNRQYVGSVKNNKEWEKDKLDGKIYGEIIAVFTGENAGILAHEYEHQMIISHWALYGEETTYNRHDGCSKFSTLAPPEETKKIMSEKAKDRWKNNLDYRNIISSKNRERLNNPEYRKRHGILIKETYDKHPEKRKTASDRTKKYFSDPENRKKTSEATKAAMQKPEVREKFLDAMKKVHSDPMWHKRQSEAQKKRYQENPEARRKNSEAQKKRFEDPEVRRRHKERQKQVMSKPEVREKISKALINNPKTCKAVLQYDKNGNFIKEWPSEAEVRRCLGIGHINDVCKGNRKSSGGFIWKYKEIC